MLRSGRDFAALETVSHDGSRTWRISALWSLVGVAAGQFLIWERWAPSFLNGREAQALGLMGAFVLMFMIRMAGATMEQKEDAEATTRASERRFRSLVQHSSDITLVVGEGDRITYASPATMVLLGLAPEDVVGMTSARSSTPMIEHVYRETWARSFKACRSWTLFRFAWPMSMVPGGM